MSDHEPRSASRTPRRRGCCCAIRFSTACAICCSAGTGRRSRCPTSPGAAGISRQTIYNEFGSRQGLAQGYALRLADRLVDAVDDAITGNVGDIYAAFLQGFRDFFAESAADPLVISLLTGGTKPDLLQLITTDSGPIITHCSAAADVDLHAQLGARQRGGRRACWPAPSSGWR